MSEQLGSEMISRRGMFSFLGLLAASSLVLPSVLTASDAEAATAGMERRFERRMGRFERRAARRAERHARRETRFERRTVRRGERRERRAIRRGIY